MRSIDVSKFPSLKARESLGGEILSIDGQTGATKIRFRPSADHNNPNGTTLGGFLAAMIDDAAGAATWFGSQGRNFATAQMSVSFLRAAKPDEALIADVVLTGMGRRQGFAEVRLTREADGKLVATGTLVQTFAGT